MHLTVLLRETRTFLKVVQRSTDDWIVTHSPPVLEKLWLRWSSEVHLNFMCQRVLEQVCEPQNSTQCCVSGACACPPNVAPWEVISATYRTVNGGMQACDGRLSEGASLQFGFVFYEIIRFFYIHLYIDSFLIGPFLFTPPPPSWPVPQLEPSQIRLIVYQDCERRGRNVLFDSNTVKRGPEETPIPVSHANFKSSVIYKVPIKVEITCGGFTETQSLSPQVGRNSLLMGRTQKQDQLIQRRIGENTDECDTFSRSRNHNC